VEIFLIVGTVISIATAAVALTIARRANVAEQRRSDARVAALAAAAVDTDAGEIRPTPLFGGSRLAEAFGEGSSGPQIRHEALFETVRRPDEGPARLGLAVGAVALLAIIVVVSVLAVRGGSSNVSTPAVHASQPQLLELLTLEHTQEMRALVITGTVRNPSAGAKLEGLTAVISLLDRNGTLIATKDVPLDYRALGPGEEAPFTLGLPDRGSIERYRVSFRAGTAIVPHVDRRGDAGASRASDAGAGPRARQAFARGARPGDGAPRQTGFRARSAPRGWGPAPFDYGVPHVSI
jgi:hypothetical protein